MTASTRATRVGLMIVLLALGMSVALAHGAPELSVKETAVAAGGRVTLSGDALGEAGQTVTIALQGAGYQANLGTVALKSDTFDGAVFTLPKDVSPGTYLLTARNGKITANTQVEIVAAAPPSPSGGHAAAPANTEPAPMASMPAPSPIVVRPRTAAEQVGALGLVILTGAVAVILLWRSRSELTDIDS